MNAHEHPGYSIDSRGVATLKIESGGPLNIIDSGTARALTEALRRMGSDPAVRVGVITGGGEKTFVGGADIKEMAALDPASARAFISDLHALCEAARDLPVPTIARVRGWCIGIGLELAASCDLRVASQDAQFVMPEVKIGIPSVIQGALLARLVGEGHARWLMLTGAPIGADTAERWGLVNQVTPVDRLDDATRQLASAMAAMGAAGMRAQKRVLRTGEAPHLDAAMRRSIDLFGQAYETTEPSACMQAFLQRRRSEG
ncbi:enoyl-CoA hydratase [Variovorax ureilyticus]|uniref:enoyl-CoA hydratase n=1 Tax=Variovorax ureilyticus TaxID=1836198 RepID=UPI003D6745AC